MSQTAVFFNRLLFMPVFSRRPEYVLKTSKKTQGIFYICKLLNSSIIADIL